MTQPDFIVIGAGLAGSEAALVLAREDFQVRVFEQKPQKFSAAHRLPGSGELVCSNSFKSLETSSAHGLLKAELSQLRSPMLELAHQAKLPGGKALVVDREKFSCLVTDALHSHENIEMIHEEVDKLPDSDIPTIVASGPLTSENLMCDIFKVCDDEGLYFYDATSPVVSLESLDLSAFFWGNRNQDGDDYLNLPLDRDSYLKFRDQILKAEKTESHLEGESLCYFEGCLPIEVLAERGEDTLRFSCMRPIGFQAHLPKKAYALIQFRREKSAGELLSMVGFQTRMKWPEQERVFRSLPGMQRAEFVRLGAMHRNSFLNAPLHLNENLQFKKRPSIYFAGQITGSEGYTEALATGHYAALRLLNKPMLPPTTAIQSLVRYLILADVKHFQPMNFNFGLLPSIEAPRLKRTELRVTRALADLESWIQIQ